MTEEELAAVKGRSWEESVPISNYCRRETDANLVLTIETLDHEPSREVNDSGRAIMCVCMNA